MRGEDFLSQTFLEAHPLEGAMVLQRFPVEDVKDFLSRMSPSKCAPIFRYLPPMVASDCLALLERELAGEIIKNLSIPVAAGLTRRMDPEVRAQLLNLLPLKISSSLKMVLRYPDGTAGFLMDPSVFSLSKDMTVFEAKRQVKKSSRHLLSYIYLIDQDQKLRGVLSIRELMLGNPRQRLSQIMKTPVSSISADAHQLSLLSHPGWKQFHKIPVTGKNGILIGVIRYKTLRGLEAVHQPINIKQKGLEFSFQLGELYWVGMWAVVQSFSPLLKNTGRKKNQ